MKQPSNVKLTVTGHDEFSLSVPYLSLYAVTINSEETHNKLDSLVRKFSIYGPLASTWETATSRDLPHKPHASPTRNETQIVVPST